MGQKVGKCIYRKKSRENGVELPGKYVVKDGRKEEKAKIRNSHKGVKRIRVRLRPRLGDTFPKDEPKIKMVKLFKEIKEKYE